MGLQDRGTTPVLPARMGLCGLCDHTSLFVAGVYDSCALSQSDMQLAIVNVGHSHTLELRNVEGRDFHT